MRQLETAFNGLGIKDTISVSPTTLVDDFNPKNITAPVLLVNPVATTLVDANNPKDISTPILLINPAPTSVNNAIQVAFTVTNGKETLPLATVQIDNQYFATTENGYFRKPDINPNSIITISYIGYNARTFKANAIPSTIVLSTSNTILDEVTVTGGVKPTTPTPTPKPITTKKSNLLGWTVFGILAGIGIKKATEKPKNQRVKIKKA